MGPIAEAAFAAMLALAPPELLAELPQWSGHEETAVEKRARYTAIALDLEEAVLDSPPLPGMNRRRTAATLLGIAFMESGFAHDADLGPCVGKRCDAGRAACLLQVQAPAEERARLFADRRACFRRGLDVARRSLVSCGGELTAYAAGNCESLIGRAAGRKRMAMGQRVLALADWR